MYKVTFYYYSRLLQKDFTNVEMHNSYAEAQLRAMALNWTIQSIEEV